jgi:hypothetical protein
MNMIPIILLLSLPPSPSAEGIQTLDLGSLTWLDAQRLDGKPVRVVITVASQSDESDRAASLWKPRAPSACPSASGSRLASWCRS